MDKQQVLGFEAKLAAIWKFECWILASDWIISESLDIASNDLDTLQSNIFNRFPLFAAAFDVDFHGNPSRAPWHCLQHVEGA